MQLSDVQSTTKMRLPFRLIDDSNESPVRTRSVYVDNVITNPQPIINATFPTFWIPPSRLVNPAPNHILDPESLVIPIDLSGRGLLNVDRNGLVDASHRIEDPFGLRYLM